MTTTQPQRPNPRFPEPDRQAFWEATKRHELTFQTCNRCKEVIFLPRRHCPSCGHDETTVHVSKGQGTLYTFSVIMQSRHPFFKNVVPYAVAYVDLDEGFRIMTNVVGVKDPVKELKCGIKVKLKWEDQGEGQVSFPLFEPA